MEIYCTTKDCPLSHKCSKKDSYSSTSLNISIIKYKFSNHNGKISCPGFKEKPKITISPKLKTILDGIN